MCGDNSTLAHTLSKIPRLHFDRVDVQVRNVDVTSPQTAWRRFERGSGPEPPWRALGDGENPGALPTVEDLESLASRLEAVADELNQARRHGFLMEAIAGSKPSKAAS